MSTKYQLADKANNKITHTINFASSQGEMNQKMEFTSLHFNANAEHLFDKNYGGIIRFIYDNIAKGDKTFDRNLTQAEIKLVNKELNNPERQLSPRKIFASINQKDVDLAELVHDIPETDLPMYETLFYDSMVFYASKLAQCKTAKDQKTLKMIFVNCANAFLRSHGSKADANQKTMQNNLNLYKSVFTKGRYRTADGTFLINHPERFAISSYHETHHQFPKAVSLVVCAKLFDVKLQGNDIKV
jgi:hypothetical protein